MIPVLPPLPPTTATARFYWAVGYEALLRTGETRLPPSALSCRCDIKPYFFLFVCWPTVSRL